jgi:hypothetical protein
MATTEEAAIMVSRIERYFNAPFPEDVSKEYLRDFKTYPADVLSQAIANICENTAHTKPPPTRADVGRAVHRIYEARAEERKKKTPTISNVIPFQKQPAGVKAMAHDALVLVRSVLNQDVRVDDLSGRMREMADKHGAVNGEAWTAEAASIEAWLAEHRALPSVKRGNWHPLPQVDAILRPEVYGKAREHGRND